MSARKKSRWGVRAKHDELHRMGPVGPPPNLGKMAAVEEPSFWRSAAALDGAITALVFRDVLIFGLAAVGWVFLYNIMPSLHLQVGPVEIAGGAMGLMLVFRSNAGYERWWEGRKLWGQITNAVRKLVQAGMAYGPASVEWRATWVRWCACFPHACRMALRNSRDPSPFAKLVGPQEAQRICAAVHMPSYVAYRLGVQLSAAARDGHLSPSAQITMEAARGELVDAIGGCERIASTPLPRVYIFKFRRFIAVYLLCLPAALVGRVGWATPFLTMLVAYPTLGLDRIAQELQAPFSRGRINHLPLTSICQAIESNALGLLNQADSMPPDNFN